MLREKSRSFENSFSRIPFSSKLAHMLRSIYIQNYILVEDGEIHFEPGLNIVTGETGAGKSILIGAISALFGERTSASVLREGCSKAIVEGHFDCTKLPALQRYLQAQELAGEDDILIIRREVLSSGRSRAFVNDTPVTLDEVEKIADQLVDLHGQHEHQSLLKTAEHIKYLDAYGNHARLLARTAQHFESCEMLRTGLEQLRARQQQLRQQQDFLTFQLEEINKVDPRPGEENELLAEEKRLAHSSELRESCSQLVYELYEKESSASEIIISAVRLLERLRGYDAAFDALAAEMQTAVISIEEVAKTIQTYLGRVEVNPSRLEEVRRRLAAFAHLKKKFACSIDEVILKKAEMEAQIRQSESLDAAITAKESEWLAAVAAYDETAAQLSAARRAAAAELEEAVPKILARIGMPNCQFSVRIDVEASEKSWFVREGASISASRTGFDRVEFYISTNPGQPQRPLAKIASGGEISRVMLALKSLIAHADHIPIVIFDEIDIGISGKVAQAVGRLLRELSHSHQIVVITHLPQIASAGHAHFLVEKYQNAAMTTTSVRKLLEGEREEAIAALLGGSVLTAAHLASARELIEMAKKD